MRRILLLPLLFLCACAEGDAWLVVESGSDWSGTVTSTGRVTQVSASGDWTFPLLRERACWELRKDDSPGYLRAYVRRDDPTGPTRLSHAETSEPGGEVRGCS